MVPDAHASPPPRTRTRTYILVLLLHAAVIAALWTFSRCFGA